MLSSWIADAQYAARRLRAHPAYALLAVLTLALGVGGTASTYAVVRGVLFDPLPYAHAREVGVFWKKTDWTHEEFLHVRGRVPGFREVALYRQRDAILREDDEPARLVPRVSASSELFSVLGVHPMLGRGFRAGEDAQGVEPVAVLSYGLWQQLGGDPAIAGKRLTIDGTPRTVVGVMPRGFRFPDPSVRIWTPEPLSAESRSWNSTLVGRVASGYDVQAMTAPVAPPARQVMALLSLLTGLALALGAVGIYGVLAHFAARRRRDWAIKVALGLPGSRVVAQVVGHGALLVAVGIGIGVPAAAAFARLLSSLLYGVRAIDPIAFATAGAALLGVGLLAAFVPAWRAGMTDPAIALREP